MKRDELNNLNINNKDGEFHTEEDSLKNVKEQNEVPEIQKEEDEVFQASEDFSEEEKEENSFDNLNSSSGEGGTGAESAGATGASTAAGVVGGVVAAVAVSAVLVLGIVKLPTIPAIDVHLLSTSSSSLTFSLNTNIEDISTLRVSLKGVDYEVSTPFQEYVKFNDLKQNEEYTLSILDNDTSRYSSTYYTNDREEMQNITINVTSYIDDKLFFSFEDAIEGEKLYTVTCKNKKGNVVYTNDTTTPRSYEIDDFKEDLAIYVYVDGVLNAGMQVFKPIYDYENIHWVWGEYGENITAIIPSLNDTDDYYVRDIRNFEIDREDPTCTTDGYVIREAAFIGPDKNRYQNEKEFVLPALGHDFSDVTYTWSSNYHVCKAESTCPHCGTSIEESVEVEITEIVNEHDVSYTLYKASFENEVFGIRNHYEDLTYGYYPQSIENDTSIINSLDATYGTPITQSGSWTSYDYYASSELSSYMYYVDVDIDNDEALDYRGVYFTSYRPINTTDALGNSSYQYDNGYLVNTTYWFKYEPISWDVLDQEDGKLLITSSIIVDSQSFYHKMNVEEFEHNGGTGFANNYELSDIRLWLNNEFFAHAFNEYKDDVVAIKTVDNSLASTLDSVNQYVCNDTEDRIFLPSRYEANEYLSSSELEARGSDYAKCQGLYTALENDSVFWGLRTPYPNQSYKVRYVTNDGATSYDSIYKTSMGVRPTLWINIA